MSILDWLSRADSGDEGFPDYAYPGTSRPARAAGRLLPPLEVASVGEACQVAAESTGSKIWRVRALQAGRWFLGGNPMKVSFYDRTTGGCFDGARAGKVIPDQGAEATLSWLFTEFALGELGNDLTARPETGSG